MRQISLLNYNQQTKHLLQSLDTVLNNKANNNLFKSNGLLLRVKRFLQEPIKRSLIKFNVNILKRKYTFPLKVQTFFGYSMHIFSCDEDLWFYGAITDLAEVKLTKFILKNIKPDDIFLDIGTHHGFYTLLVHRLLKECGTIHSFEPTKLHFNILKKNIKNKNNIHINKLALYSKEGNLQFYEHGRGSSTIDKNFFNQTNNFKHEKFNEIKVKRTTLDQYCERLNIKPTFLKIDVEGAEFDVLLGAQQTLKKYSPTIAMEVWRSPLDYSNHIKAINFLIKNNYKPFKINSDGSTHLINQIIPNNNVPSNMTQDNFVFKKI